MPWLVTPPLCKGSLLHAVLTGDLSWLLHGESALASVLGVDTGITLLENLPQIWLVTPPPGSQSQGLMVTPHHCWIKGGWTHWVVSSLGAIHVVGSRLPYCM